ncbi:unnamed protein product [Rotaria sp. Silwood1]|nr:unnamed protein product [Rotaria sp. Silwood1]
MQNRLAKILKTVLGDALITQRLPNLDPSVLPSPEQLKYKVLIQLNNQKFAPVLEGNLSFIEHLENLEDIVRSRVIAPELTELCVYLQNIPIHEKENAEKNIVFLHESSSLVEDQFLQETKNNPIGFVQQATQNILRVCPNFSRHDASNPNPIPMWNCGVQMVALNILTEDDNMALYHGKFSDNGNCGYVLKPNYLISTNQTPINPWNPQANYEDPLILTIKIISGQFLPRSKSKLTDVPDPYVKISTHGLSCDEKIHKTKYIDNNGFDPIWNETFVFHIRFPQLCMVHFSLMDYDVVTEDERMAYCCAPVTMLRTGK